MKHFLGMITLSVVMTCASVVVSLALPHYAQETKVDIKTVDGAIHALFIEWGVGNNYQEDSYLYKNLSKVLGNDYKTRISNGEKDYEIICRWCENYEFTYMMGDGLDVECDDSLYDALGGEDGCIIFDTVCKIYNNHPCDDDEDPLNIVCTFFMHGKNGVSKEFYEYCVKCANEKWHANNN